MLSSSRSSFSHPLIRHPRPLLGPRDTRRSRPPRSSGSTVPCTTLSASRPRAGVTSGLVLPERPVRSRSGSAAEPRFLTPPRLVAVGIGVPSGLIAVASPGRSVSPLSSCAARRCIRDSGSPQLHLLLAVHLRGSRPAVTPRLPTVVVMASWSCRVSLGFNQSALMGRAPRVYALGLQQDESHRRAKGLAQCVSSSPRVPHRMVPVVTVLDHHASSSGRRRPPISSSLPCSASDHLAIPGADYPVVQCSARTGAAYVPNSGGACPVVSTADPYG